MKIGQVKTYFHGNRRVLTWFNFSRATNSRRVSGPAGLLRYDFAGKFFIFHDNRANMVTSKEHHIGTLLHIAK